MLSVTSLSDKEIFRLGACAPLPKTDGLNCDTGKPLLRKRALAPGLAERYGKPGFL
jgi:hypothetical protein